MSETENSEKQVVEGKNKILPFFVALIVINVAAIFYFYTKIESINNIIYRIEQANATISQDITVLRSMVLFEDKRSMVDLSDKAVQSIGDGFSVTNLSIQPHMSGVKINGEIINSQSLEYSGLNLKIDIMGFEKSVFINKLKSGFSSKFSAIMLNVDPKTARFAKMWMDNYTVHWYQGN